jgi:pyruvate ferredoxin oxidoreductase beta subunit
MNNILKPNNSLCLGCGAGIAANQIIQAIDKPVVLILATGCLEVGTTTYPNNSWPIPIIHANFGNAASVASGIARAKKISFDAPKDLQVIVLAGDGATYDIGLSALSGMAERGEDILYICYNNQAYMNTGTQKSGATPLGAKNTTQLNWEMDQKIYPKSMIKIMLAHKIPYVAQTIPIFENDLQTKIKKALDIKGPRYIEILSPCIHGWYYEPKDSLDIIKLAVESNFWPLLEYENEKLKINYLPKEKVKIETWMKLQKRFSATMKNKELVANIQNQIDQNWQELLKK